MVDPLTDPSKEPLKEPLKDPLKGTPFSSAPGFVGLLTPGEGSACLPLAAQDENVLQRTLKFPGGYRV